MAINNTTSNLYGVQPDRISRQAITGSRTRAFGMQFPAGMDTGASYFCKVTGIKLIKQNLIQLLKTTRGERLMLPNFGTNLKKYLMEPLDQYTLNKIKEEITESIYLYAKNVKILKLQIFEITKVGPYNPGIYINLYCSLVEQQDSNFELKVNLS